MANEKDLHNMLNGLQETGNYNQELAEGLLKGIEALGRGDLETFWEHYNAFVATLPIEIQNDLDRA